MNRLETENHPETCPQWLKWLKRCHLEFAWSLTRWASLAFVLVSISIFSSAQAQETQRFQAAPMLKDKNFMSNAIGLQITPRGMETFKTRLRSLIVTTADFDPSDVTFDPFEKKFEKPIPWDDIRLSPANRQVLDQTKKFLSELLIGFSFNEVQPWILVGGAQFEARFSRFALVSDEELLHLLGKTMGAVLALELEVQEAQLSTDSIKVFDLNNHLFKKPFGMTDLSVKIAGKNKKPLKVRLPFYVSITPESTLQFEAIRVESNLSTVDIEPAYSQILSPSISLTVDDQTYQVNPKKLDSLFKNSKPMIVEKLKSFLSDFAQTELPRILNEKVQASMVKKLEEVQPLSAPGSLDKDDHFFYGLQLGQIRQDKSLFLNMNAYIEDAPSHPHAKPRPQDKSRGAPSFNWIDPSTYDCGVSVDRGFINRLLQLSFERKFFEKIPVTNETTLKLTAVPTIDSISTTAPLKKDPATDPKQTQIKIQISLQVPAGMVQGVQKLAISDHFEMSIQAIAQLKEMPFPACGDYPGDKGISIMLTKLNLDSLVIDEKWLTGIGKLFKNKVLNSIKGALSEISTPWQQQGQSIGGCFIPPTEVIGLKLDVARLDMDPQGHLMIYFTYAKGARSGMTPTANTERK